MIKLNDANQYEPIEISLSPAKTPIAYKNKVHELIGCGLSCEEAEKEALKPIELEIYYETDCGLFLIESDAVESGTVYSPYTGKLCDEADDY